MSDHINNEEGDEHVHAPVAVSIFTRRGKLRAHDEMCACSVPYLNMADFPKGCYVTVLAIPTQQH